MVCFGLINYPLFVVDDNLHDVDDDGYGSGTGSEWVCNQCPIILYGLIFH